MAGLHYLKHLIGISDKQTVRGWVKNPYWQYLCGEEFFQHAFPTDPSQMSRWRQRIDELKPWGYRQPGCWKYYLFRACGQTPSHGGKRCWTLG